jgi:hypothetical protein
VGFENAQPLLHLDHSSLQIGEIAANRAQEFQDEIAKFLRHGVTVGLPS